MNLRVIGLVGLAACGGSDVVPQMMMMEPGEMPQGLRGACPAAERLGGFRADALERFSSVEGTVLEGVVPVTIPKEARREGACALHQQRYLQCPPCGAAETCGSDNTCIPYPSQKDMGTVTIEGLEKVVEMQPRTPGFRYFDTSLPNPPYRRGAQVHLRTTKGLELWGIGVDPLALDAGFILRVSRTEPILVSWSSPAAGAVSKIELSINVDQHGASPFELVCIFEDVGRGEVPVSLVEEFLDAGISGYPNGKLVRYTADSQNVDGGCVDFLIADVEKITVRVPDHLPCSATDPCPDGLSCDIAVNTCR